MYKFILIFIFLFLQSCTLQLGKKDKVTKSEKPRTFDNQIENQKRKFSQIGSGDLLKIDVYGEKELTGIYQVSPDGSIVFPFIGKILVAGKTNLEISNIIANRLKDGYIKDPQITVMVKEYRSKRVYVLGQVKKAGSFVIKDRMSVIEAISLAGGFTNIADIKNVIITRKEKNGKEIRFNINIDNIVKGKEKEFYLKSGDIIFVTERFF